MHEKSFYRITFNYFYFAINACQFIQQYFNRISKTIEIIMKLNVSKQYISVHTKLY